MAESEVARLLRQIAMEYEAAHSALHGPAVVAPHRRRTGHTERIGELHQELQNLVGEQEAMRLVAVALDQA